ncbi:MAG TPA: cupin domain-containing protein [Bryobacteraceae bacterium]|nr:cupin domain-containing protein [Bryobacteraceae bacterium]
MHPFSQLSEVLEHRRRSGKLYHEFLRVPSMSVGVYVLAAGAADPQKPHEQDEMYYVVSGRGRMQAGGEDRAVEEGSVIFVPAQVAHRFYDISEELVVLVFFAPAETA